MRKRSRARELALQILYQIDLRGEDVRDRLELVLARTGKPAEICDFARELIEGTDSIRAEIDDRITEVAEHWDVRRMAVIDRNILRMAIYEMTERDDIPRKVSINEAIELGKKYSTKQSGAFINGILDRIRKGLDGEESK